MVRETAANPGLGCLRKSYHIYGIPQSGDQYAASMAEKPPPLKGPRGGETTRKPGRVKKTVWLHEDEAEELRRAAYELYRSEASLIREAIRRYFSLED